MAPDIFDSPSEPAPPGPSSMFIAGFRSECPGCGDEIMEGDEAVMYQGSAYHEDCGHEEYGLDQGMPEW